MKAVRKISGVLVGIATGVLTGVGLFLAWKAFGSAATPTPARSGAYPAAAKAGAALHGGARVGFVDAVPRLRAWLILRPNRSIPEIALLDDSIWTSVGDGIDFSSEESIVAGVRALRSLARQEFGAYLAGALARYAEANHGALPEGVMELRPFLDAHCTNAMLRRYAMLMRGSYQEAAENVPLVGEIAGVDDDIDSTLSVSKGRLTRLTADRAGVEVQRAIHRHLHASGGELPTGTVALKPFLKIPVADFELRKYFNKGGIEISTKN